jgi:hypothetical protein
VPSQIGSYQVVSEINRGGMGIVYHARDPVLRREVAIKVLLAAEGATDEDVKRFQREAQSAARLQHPNIVSIHAIGEYEGQPFFVMDFVQGRTVKKLLESGPLQPRVALSITAQAAAALAHAARHGVIHRDVKPANILVNEEGVARIMDFGLARRVDEDLEITQSGTTMGTPSYMSPEQAEGRLEQVDAQSDLYSLGAVLYEMLSGRPPFDGPGTMVILRKVLEEDPLPPRKINPNIHPDIQTMCLKCLEKEKSRRYADCAELAEDIRRFNAGEPISALPITRLGYWLRKARKHLHLTITIAAVLAFGLTALGYGIYSAVREARRQDQERQQELAGCLKRGGERLGAARSELAALTASASGEFETQASHARRSLLESSDLFRNAQRLAPHSNAARDGLLQVEKAMNALEVERFLFKARSFLNPPPLEGQPAPPPNYPAALAFAEEALARDPLNAEALSIKKKAIGIRAVTITASGGQAEVTAQPLADSLGQRLAQPGQPVALGRTPIREREMSPGLYLLSFQRAEGSVQEATLLVSRDSDPALQITLNCPDRNMVLIPAGAAALPAVGQVHVPAFAIDRFEHPNQAGVMPTAGIETLLEARALCEKDGKKLCTPAQWTRACMGDEQRKWPYGPNYLPGACATGFDPDAQHASFPSGFFPRCHTPEGVFDMSGNVAEWTDGSEDSEIVLGGNWTDSVRWGDVYISCRAREVPSLANRDRAGVRCCKDME